MTFQAFALTLLALAFPFHNWLVMLRATKAHEDDRAAIRRRRGVAKPDEGEASGWGTFSDGF